MRLKAQRPAGGKHRKLPTPQTKSRVALVAVATGAVSSAGLSGAAAATLQTQAETPISPQDTAGGVQLATHDTALPPDTTETAPQILTISEYKPVTNIDEQLDKAVEYAAERTEAARAEAARLEAERIEAERLANASSVVKPTEGTFTSGFGMRWGSLHAGLDIANVVGTPILAAMGGTVIDSGPASGFGQWIRIQHDDGSIAVYGHMETLDVSVGEQVTAGQKIAGMGNRGFSTGSHLHFELYPTGSGAVDPAPWFAQHGITF